MSAQLKSRFAFVTPEEYLRLEEEAEFKHEYMDGQVIAMAGASGAHIDLSGTIYAELFIQLRGKLCVPKNNDCRVRTPGDELYAYPDVSVACNPEYLKNHSGTLLNPVVIFEVLSPSSRERDRVEKFARYKLIPTLRDYVLVSQDRMLVEHQSKSMQTEQEHWWFRHLTQEDEVLVLDSIGCRLRLADIYALVNFDEVEPEDSE